MGRHKQLRVASCQLLMALLSCLGVTMAAEAAQNVATVDGTWDVHIEHATGRIVDEQWIIRQDGSKVTGKVNAAGREFPLEGSVDHNKINFKVTVTATNFNIFVGTVDGDSIKGEIKKANDDGTFSAKRSVGHKVLRG